MAGETDYCCGIVGLFIGAFGLAYLLTKYTPIPSDWIGSIIVAFVILGIIAQASIYWKTLRSK